MVGVVLILVAVFYPEQPHAVLWYWQDGKVYKYDTKTRETEEVKLPANGKVLSAKLSRDGKHIAFADDEGLKITGSSFKTVELQINHEGNTPLVAQTYGPLSWSPSSEFLFVSKLGWEMLAIYNLSIRDGQLHSLPSVFDNGSTLECQTGLDWSPDSQQFTTGFWGFGYCDGKGGVYISPINNGQLERIYVENVPIGKNQFEGGVSNMKWSPHGDWIAFSQADSAGRDTNSTRLMLVKPNGSKSETLVNSDRELGELAWSPDGTYIYFVSFDDGLSNLNRIEIVSFSSVILCSSKSIYQIAIAPDGNQLTFLSVTHTSNKESVTLWLFDIPASMMIQVGNPVFAMRDIGFVGWQMVP